MSILSSALSRWTLPDLLPERALALILIAAFLLPTAAAFAASAPDAPARPEREPILLDNDDLSAPSDSLPAGDAAYLDVETVVTADDYPYGLDGKKIFNPDPTRAVWLSALFPGLGQIYNRRYWKLPIIVAGFMGLGYGASWNNGQYQDYSQAYRDILDSDPSTNSYMDFFPPTTQESSLDKSWLSQTMKNRKDYYRRNRDLCIICMVGLYLLCMVDAYVDASLSHFDISPDLSMDVAPSMIIEPGSFKPKPALTWAFTF